MDRFRGGDGGGGVWAQNQSQTKMLSPHIKHIQIKSCDTQTVETDPLISGKTNRLACACFDSCHNASCPVCGSKQLA